MLNKKQLILIASFGFVNLVCAADRTKELYLCDHCYPAGAQVVNGLQAKANAQSRQIEELKKIHKDQLDQRTYDGVFAGLIVGIAATIFFIK